MERRFHRSTVQSNRYSQIAATDNWINEVYLDTGGFAFYRILISIWE
jgi:hypothetical protein